MLLEYFRVWLEESVRGYTMTKLAREHPVMFAEAVTEFGKLVYVHHWARGSYAETLNAITHRFHWLRGSLGGAWKIIEIWTALEPTQVRPPCPLLLLKAMVGLSIAWDWCHMAAVLLVAFFGLLRPCEMLRVRLSHLMWPEEHKSGSHVYLKVQEPKSRA